MRSLTISFFSFMLLICIISCDKVEPEITEKKNDCVFVQNDESMDGQIDESERSIMLECTDNALSSKTSIAQNLLGEWKLIGHGEGWLHSYSQPCGYITITEEGLTVDFENANTKSTTDLTWEIQEINYPSGTIYSLKTSDAHEILFINNFSENYMFGDATPSDGNMYLFEKVK